MPDQRQSASRPPTSGEEDALRRRQAEGVAYAVAAYTAWGFVVLLYGALEHVGTIELIAQRIVWCLLFITIVLAFRHSFGRLAEALRSPRLLMLLTFSATLMAVNWGVFIWTIAESRVLEASLGYYINPLVSVFLGVVLLGERLSRAQIVAIGIALVGVAIFGLSFGVLPWIPITLASLFGAYGYIRKIALVGPAVGLFIESVLICVLAVPYLIWLAKTGQSSWGANAWTPWLLIATGPATALPLMWFTAGAQRVRLSTLGMLQYIAPTLHLVFGVMVFGENLTTTHLVTFALIWVALTVFTIDMVKTESRARRAMASMAAARPAP